MERQNASDCSKSRSKRMGKGCEELAACVHGEVRWEVTICSNLKKQVWRAILSWLYKDMFGWIYQNSCLTDGVLLIILLLSKPDLHTVKKQRYTQVELSSCSVPDSDSLCTSCCTHRWWVPYPDYRWQCCLSVGGTGHRHLLIMAYQTDKLKTSCDICMEV